MLAKWGVWRWRCLHRVWCCLCSIVRGRLKTWSPCFSHLCPNYHSAFPSAFSRRHELALLHRLTTGSMQMPWLQHLHPLYKHWTAAVMLATPMRSLLGLSQWSILWLEILFFTGTTSRFFIASSCLFLAPAKYWMWGENGWVEETEQSVAETDNSAHLINKANLTKTQELAEYFFSGYGKKTNEYF